MKKFICGLIIGLLMATCLTVYAGDLIVNPNPFPILVNGVKQDIEAYNINGSTYLKMAQVGLVTGAVVEFNTEKKQIEITTDFMKPPVPTDSSNHFPKQKRGKKCLMSTVLRRQRLTDANGIYIGVADCPGY